MKKPKHAPKHEPWNPTTPEEKAAAFELLARLEDSAAEFGRFTAELEAAMSEAPKKPPKPAVKRARH
jgi:hypothetical protein